MNKDKKYYIREYLFGSYEIQKDDTAEVFYNEFINMYGKEALERGEIEIEDIEKFIDEERS